MNLKRFLICTLSSIVLLGCPATSEDEDINEIPPKENNEMLDAGEVGICTLPAEAGPCEADLPRFYFNASTGQCESFSYGGCEGNANNFETLEACEVACGAATHLDAGEPPANEPEDAGGSPTQENSEDAGPNNITETSDAGHNTPAADAGTVNICALPAEAGMCMAAFQRFYFNYDTGQCESFLYGGCGGNANNFETLEACEAACGTLVSLDAGNVEVQTENSDAGTLASNTWDFVSFGGCGDVFIHGKNADDTVGLAFTDGLNLNLAEMAHQAGTDTYTSIFDLAVSPDSLTITEGTNVTYESCNDALLPNINVSITRTWKPISGTATITITPDGEPTAWGTYPANAVLVLEDVVLSPTDDDSVTVSLENMTITAAVGWLPG